MKRVEETDDDRKAQLDDGMCVMVCERMRLVTEQANELHVTDEDMQRFVEQVEKLRMAMTDVRKQWTGEDLQRATKMEEDAKLLMEETTGRGTSKGCRGRGRDDESRR